MIDRDHKLFVERLWRSLKYEREYLKVYAGVSVAKADIDGDVDWFNARHPHSSLERLTPHESPLINRGKLFKQTEPLLCGVKI